MKLLSPEAEILFAVIHGHVYRERPRLLREIGSLQEPAAIPRLALFLFDHDDAQRWAAAGVIDELLRGVAPADIPALDQLLRQAIAADTRAASTWPAEVARLADGPRPCAVLRILSCHPRGTVRQEAVRQLANLAGGDDLPFLLLRCSDWAWQVAQEATSAIQRCLTPVLAGAWLQYFPLVLRLEQQQRGPHYFVAQVEDFLVAQVRPEELLLGIAGSEAQTRRRLWRLLARSADFPFQARLELAREQADATIRREIVSEAQAQLSLDQAESALAAFLRDANASVRREALRVLAEGFAEVAWPWLEAALLDKSAAVRATARFHLQRRGGSPDFAARYREALSATTAVRLQAAITGLAETGEAADALFLLPHLASPSPAVRRRAIQAVVRLASGEHRDLILPLLRDAAPAVSREAMRALKGNALSVDAELLWEIIVSAEPRQVRLHALELLGVTPGWDALLFLLRGATGPDPEVAAITLAQLWGRCGGSSAPMSEVQMQSLSGMLDQCGAALPSELVLHLRFALRTARRT